METTAKTKIKLMESKLKLNSLHPF